MESNPERCILCCPEDVSHCGGEHAAYVCCEKCRVPVCRTCHDIMRGRNGKNVGVPMALARAHSS